MYGSRAGFSTLSWWPFGGGGGADSQVEANSSEANSSETLKDSAEQLPQQTDAASTIQSTSDTSAILDSVVAAEVAPQSVSVSQGAEDKLANMTELTADVSAENAAALLELTDPSPWTLWYWTCNPAQLLINELHTFSHLSWASCIVLSSMVVRLALLPLSISQQRNIANMSYARPVIERIQEEFKQRKAMSGKTTKGEQQLMQRQIREVMKKNNTSVAKNFLMLWNMPVLVTFFIALRSIGDRFEGFDTGGWLWFQDLSAADPYVALPVISSLTMMAVPFFAQDRSLEMGRLQKMLQKFFLVLPWVFFPFIYNFPCTIFLYWISSNLFTIAFTVGMRQPTLRKAFGIRPIFKPPKKTLGSQEADTQATKGSILAAPVTRTVEVEAATPVVPTKTFTTRPPRGNRKKNQR